MRKGDGIGQPPPERRAEFDECWARGDTQVQIAERFGVNKLTIWRWSKALGMPKRPNPGTRHGHGHGYGGSAKGETALPAARAPFEPGNPGFSGAGAPPGAVGGSLPTYKSLAKGERVDALKELQWKVANFGTQADGVRLAAMDKLLDREEGKPVQPTVNMHIDDLSSLSDDEIRAELAGAGGTGAPIAARIASEGDPG